MKIVSSELKVDGHGAFALQDGTAKRAVLHMALSPRIVSIYYIRS